MSYNIDSWKTKRLDNLVIPLAAFFKHERTDWHPKLTADASNPGDVMIDGGCGQTIKAKLEDEKLTIQKFYMSGEGSGTFLDWILEPSLKESTGELEAVLIWEGGDSVTRLTVRDGVVKNTEIDL